MCSANCINMGVIFFAGFLAACLFFVIFVGVTKGERE